MFLIVGTISNGQVLQILPFGNNVDMIQIKGEHLKKTFEHSVAKYDRHDRPGAFLQMSGKEKIFYQQCRLKYIINWTRHVNMCLSEIDVISCNDVFKLSRR